MGLPNNLGKLSNMITSTGSAVGIGTTNPNDLLEVRGGFIRLSATAGNGPQFNIYSNGQTNNHVTLAQGFALATDNVGYLYNRANAAFVFGTNNAERMRITSSGNVGIANTNPIYKLDVHNGSDFDIRLRDTSLGGTVGILFETANDFSGTSQAYIKGIGAGNSGVSQLIFGTAGGSGDTTATERMRITSGGSVGMGTNNPQARLQVNGTSGASIAFQINDETDTRRCFFIANQYYGYMWAVSVVANGGKAMSFGNAGGASEVGSIVANASSTTYNTSSDYRLKEDLKDFDGLDILSKIKFYDFKWKSEDARTTGVIAHELQEVVPYAVQGEKDEIGKDDKPSYQGVDYSKLVAIMGKAIQELSAKVTALENK